MYKNLADKSFGLGICPYYDLSWLSRGFLLDLDRIRVSMLGDGFNGGNLQGCVVYGSALLRQLEMDIPQVPE